MAMAPWCHPAPMGSATGTPHPGNMAPQRMCHTHGAITHHWRTLGTCVPQRHVATAPTILSHTPGGVPSWGQGSPEDTWSFGIPTSLSHSCGTVVAGDSFMFLFPHSRHSGDQGDPPGEEFPGFRALPRGRSQAGLHHVLHHPLRDGLQAADAQRGR